MNPDTQQSKEEDVMCSKVHPDCSFSNKCLRCKMIQKEINRELYPSTQQSKCVICQIIENHFIIKVNINHCCIFCGRKIDGNNIPTPQSQ